MYIRSERNCSKFGKHFVQITHSFTKVVQIFFKKCENVVDFSVVFMFIMKSRHARKTEHAL